MTSWSPIVCFACFPFQHVCCSSFPFGLRLPLQDAPTFHGLLFLQATVCAWPLVFARSSPLVLLALRLCFQTLPLMVSLARRCLFFLVDAVVGAHPYLSSLTGCTVPPHKCTVSVIKRSIVALCVSPVTMLVSSANNKSNRLSIGPIRPLLVLLL